MTGPVGQIHTLRVRYANNLQDNSAAQTSVTAGQEALSPFLIAQAYSRVPYDQQTSDYYTANDTAALEGNGGKQISVQILRQAVEAKSRKLQARWTFEAAQDAQSQHGIDVEAEIMAALAQEITAEIDQEILLSLATLATTEYTFNQATVSGTATSCTFTGLSNVKYGIVVTPYGTNSATGATIVGTASVSTTSDAYSNMTLVNAGGASVAGGSVSAQWIAPTVAPGATGLAPTGYTVTATDAAGVAKTCAAAATDKVCTVTGLKDSTSYTVSIEADNAVGASSIVTSFVVKTLASSAPTAPTISSVTSTATGLSVTWAAPASLGSAAKLVGYWVTATDALSLQQRTCAYNATYGVIMAPAVNCEISGLTVGGNYTVSVTAIAVDANLAKLLSPAATKAATFTGVNPEPVIATFSAVTAKQKSVSALTTAAKTALDNLISTVNDGAKITVTGYGTTKAIALARANAAANYLFNNGAAVHVTVKTVISKSIKTALVTVTSN
jgi:hypothetical protein